MIAALALAAVAYTKMTLDGWTMQVETALMRKPEWLDARWELHDHLYRISRVVPDQPLAKLRKVVIWIHINDHVTQCMAYHPAADWLREHGANPNMEHGIEIGNAKTFLNWTYEQPWMVLHELAHAYHYLYLDKGEENPGVKAAYESAMKAKRYDDVLHWNGKRVRHYACTNPMEYFAEATEAYFGQNDFYPFNNAELRTYDPETFALMEKIWGKPQKRW